ncbi:MAG: type 1 glutamine amidotransferase domain-containing protein [Acidimicrobiales bacterium]
MARIAFVLADDFEDSEFQVPYERVRESGHHAVVVGKEKGVEVTGKRGRVKQGIDATPELVSVNDLDALVVPGGYSPDKLRTDSRIVSLVKHMDAAGKTVAFICHAGSLLIEADAVRGRRVTSWPSIKTDLVNAGAEWVDEPVVEDGNFISSRKPDDLEPFSAALLARFTG